MKLTPLRYLAAALFVLAVTLTVALQLQSEPGSADPTYVGQESCMAANCHEGPYGPGSDYQGAHPFRETMHQKIHNRPSPETVILDRLFETDTVISSQILQIRAQGQDTLKARLYKEGGDYMTQLYFSGGGDSTIPMKVAYTYGGIGWIERYLVEVNERYYVLPFQYVLPAYRARVDTGGAFYWLDMNKWFDIDQTTQAGVFFDMASPTFLKKSWHETCAPCHINGFDMSAEIVDTGKVWTSTWVGSRSGDSALQDQNIKIGCESCHGPGSEHVANPTAANIVSPGRTDQFPRTFAGTDLKLDLCNQCHNRFKSTGRTHNFAWDEANDRPFIPGQRLKDYQLDSLTGMSRWPDGVTSYAHHQTGQDFMRSREYLAHVFKDGCWSCHSPHRSDIYDSSFGGPLPYQLKQNWYTLEQGQGCLSCHEDKGETGMSQIFGREVNLHTQHSPEVSQCVNCHFTKTATIAFVELPNKPLHEFSDHSFKVLSPKKTLDFALRPGIGMINTCAESCHRNGRGSRNFADSTPAAPSFGTLDENVYQWNDPADRILADSLWRHFQVMFKPQTGFRVGNGIVRASAISSVTPNPLRTTSTIRYDVAASGHITVGIYSTTGELVRLLVNGHHQRGNYSVVWDAANEHGGLAANGTYIVRVSGAGGEASAKIVVLK